MAVDIDNSGQQTSVPGADPAAPGASGDPTLIRLTTPGGAAATIHPGVGFNLFDWRIPTGAGQLQLLHHDADVLNGGSGTRSGNPILFPFPNRIADARYSWAGKDYTLPVAHPGDRHAIHGFCATVPWTHYEASGEHAVTGEFVLGRDGTGLVATGDQVGLWPGDLRLRVTFELGETTLRIASEVTNVDDHDVPFGLGFHPYFATLGASSADDVRLQCDAAAYFVLEDSIPTGQVLPVTGANDLREGPTVGDRDLDDMLTSLPRFTPDADGLMRRAGLAHGDVSLALRCDEAFRDIVVFTSAHRQAIAVEPYTCPTDAVHLAAAGREVGWRSLAPGQTWIGVVEYAVTMS